MLLHIVNRRRLHKLEKLVSDPYLLYLVNKNMFKLIKPSDIVMYYYKWLRQSTSVMVPNFPSECEQNMLNLRRKSYR
jgi:hypothetical protein